MPYLNRLCRTHGHVRVYHNARNCPHCREELESIPSRPVINNISKTENVDISLSKIMVLDYLAEMSDSHDISMKAMKDLHKVIEENSLETTIATLCSLISLQLKK